MPFFPHKEFSKSHISRKKKNKTEVVWLIAFELSQRGVILSEVFICSCD